MSLSCNSPFCLLRARSLSKVLHINTYCQWANFNNLVELSQLLIACTAINTDEIRCFIVFIKPFVLAEFLSRCILVLHRLVLKVSHTIRIRGNFIFIICSRWDVVERELK